MNTTDERRIRIETEMPVHIPTPDGKAIAETVMVKVPAFKDALTGEVYLTGEALEIMDKAKARHMGILLPGEIKEMRLRMNLTQRQLSELLGTGEKTYTRWENGRERPSQSLNRLLAALWEGRLSIGDLKSSRQPVFSWFDRTKGVNPSGLYGEQKPQAIPLAANTEMPDTDSLEVRDENRSLAA